MLIIELNDAIKAHNVDLLIIEGMARALHTNLNAKFKCETLKLAVIKNRWLANRLGGDTFSILCKYEAPNLIDNNTDDLTTTKSTQTNKR